MDKNIKKGNLYVISGPSGVGKGTLLSAILEKHSNIKVSVSATTRNPRAGEKDGVNYFFTSKDKFEQLVKEDQLLEWAEFAGNYYGTFTKTVEDNLSKGNDLALEIDVKGALQVKQKIKDAILIFILPPSFEELKSRLIGRNTETHEAIEKRLSIVKDELEKVDQFNYQVTNDDFDVALKELESILLATKEA